MKKSSIRPFISKKPGKNMYDYYDRSQKTTIKAAAFDIDVYDSIRGNRIRKRIKADYRTVKSIVDSIKKAIHYGDPDKVDALTGKKAKTLLDLYNAFCKDKKKDTGRVGSGVSELTLDRYKVALKGLLPDDKRTDEGLRTIPIKKVTINWIEKRIQERKRAGLSLHTINSDIIHVKALFNWGIKHGYVGSNPFNSIPKFKVSQKEPRILTLEEWGYLRDVAESSKWYPLILTYVFTGARISEILKPKLSWHDIDFEKNTITLSVRKRDKSLTLPIPGILRDELLKLKTNPYRKANSSCPDERNYPFPFSPDYIYHVIKALFEKAGIIDASPHDLRRTFGSYLIMAGVSVYDVSEIMSHSSVQVTEQAYLAQLDSGKRIILDKLEKHLFPEIEDGEKTRGISDVVQDYVYQNVDNNRETTIGLSSEEPLKTLT